MRSLFKLQENSNYNDICNTILETVDEKVKEQYT